MSLLYLLCSSPTASQVTTFFCNPPFPLDYDKFLPFSFFRNYTGPTSGVGDERRSRNYGSRGQYSPVIEIDEDSHSKFITESGVRASVGPGGSGRGGGVQPEEPEEIEYKLDRYCQPRNSLLSLISDFVVNCSAKLTEINKKERQEKSMELLDNKCYMKLVDIAHSLLKMAPYDQVS